MSIQTEIDRIEAIRDRIASKIRSKGVAVSLTTKLDSMPDLIDLNLVKKPTGTLSITENGTHDVSNYASATVDVESGASIETCTVTLNALRLDYGQYVLLGYCATQFVDGNFSVVYHAPSTTTINGTVTIENVVCGSSIVASMSRTLQTIANVSGGDSEILATDSNKKLVFLKASTTPTEVRFNLYCD